MSGLRSKLNIELFPRLHVTLISMHESGYRRNGGIGFAIAKPSCHLHFHSSKTFQFEDRRIHPISSREVERLQEVIADCKRKFGFSRNIGVELTGQMRTHFGFGSGTGIRLACLEALFLLNGRQANAGELTIASRRGGTSGIGIHSYFNGGAVFDLGRKSSSAFLPSHKAEIDPAGPLLLKQADMPLWPIGICMPNDLPLIDEDAEQEFFRTVCPIPTVNSYEVLYHALFGVFAAVMENDQLSFCKAIRGIQSCHWKAAERSLHGAPLLTYENSIYTSGAKAVGMSSLGPALFFLSDDMSASIKNLVASKLNCEWIVTEPLNHGRHVTYE